ncbi:5'-methylthioribose kinase [Hoeflea halophila]|uniref:S-methyl-5-thioribose kinase n=1 Tax=Hoeflea halophila TaxID=714899 RepID=A0A286IE71_9HYPH|nr:S-methyl-5-thioribose kinase [Hoeflea halophila]SOE18443.1 5'-methylthioribose kinase [Hoeflea halophila]
MSNNYKPLSPETLCQRLGELNVMKKAVGANADAWTVREVGDGNLNLVFIVEGDAGSVIVKQALPYVRLVGDSWPLPLKRAFFEYHALTRQEARDPGSVPEVLHFDESQALIVMERLQPHIILRQQTMEGRKVAGLGKTLGLFAARTAFRGSDLSMTAKDKKADVALFADNVELCDITEALVFTDPYYDAEMNRHTTPQLDGIVAELRNDTALKVEVQHMKRAFTSRGETMCHGDLHAGSIMVTDDEARIIDPEFAYYGPFGFDIGMLIGNYLMAYHAMPAHISDAGKCSDFQDWILSVIEETWSVFRQEFLRLWRTERTGILYPKALYEEQGHNFASESAAEQLLAEIFRDLVGFAGIEMHRRILGLAHVAEIDTIEDEDLKARCEAKCLKLGQFLVINRNRLTGMDAVLAAARRAETGA